MSPSKELRCCALLLDRNTFRDHKHKEKRRQTQDWNILVLLEEIIRKFIDNEVHELYDTCLVATMLLHQHYFTLMASTHNEFTYFNTTEKCVFSEMSYAKI